ncbi:MAG: hypothetical protein V4543_15470 [Bacteroidota bacterium]
MDLDLVAASSDLQLDSVIAQKSSEFFKLTSEPHYSVVEKDAALIEAQETADKYHSESFAIWSRICFVISAFIESMVIILKMIAKSDYTIFAENQAKMAQQTAQRRADLMIKDLEELTTPSTNTAAVRADLQRRIRDANTVYRHIRENYQQI